MEAEIEQFKHVVKCLELYWGDPEFLMYHRKLTISDRTHRQGFPPAVIEEIQFLYQLYCSQYKLINRMPMTASQQVEMDDILGNNDVWFKHI